MTEHDDQEIEDTAIREPRVVPEPADEGKDVVDADYHDVGMVTDVQGNTMYVDANTALTERVVKALDWDENRRTDLPVTSEFVERIDDEVVLTVERSDDTARDDG